MLGSSNKYERLTTPNTEEASDQRPPGWSTKHILLIQFINIILFLSFIAYWFQDNDDIYFWRSNELSNCKLIV